MTKIEKLEGLGFVPAFKGAQGGMLLERIEEAQAKSLATLTGGVAIPPQFSTWWVGTFSSPLAPRRLAPDKPGSAGFTAPLLRALFIFQGG